MKPKKVKVKLILASRQCSQAAYRKLLGIVARQPRLQLDYMRKFRRWPDIIRPRLHSERLLVRALFDRDPLLTSLCSKAEMKSMARHRVEQLGVKFAATKWTGEAGELSETVKRLATATEQNIVKPNNLGGGLIHFLEERGGEGDAGRSLQEFIEHSLSVRRDFEKFAPIAWKPSQGGFIVEERIGERRQVLKDYKVHLFCGAPKIVSVYANRGHTMSTGHYDLEGNLLFAKNPSRIDLKPTAREIGRLVDASSMLDFGLAYTRVDFYLEKDSLWFGEVSPFGNMDGLESDPALDLRMGDWWLNAH